MRTAHRPADTVTLWAQACETLRARLGQQNYATWIAPLRCTWIEDDVTLEAPDRLTRDLVGRHFTEAIADVLATVAGRRCALRFEVPPVPAPLPIRTTPPLPDHSFQAFEVGESNARAFSAARAVAARETTAPLFLHGPAGVGKTHLLHAIAHELDARRLAVASLPAARFIEGLVAAIGNDRHLDFWHELHVLHALLLDDVHALAGQEGMQEHLMDGLVSWARDGRILVLTSDRTPADVAGLAARVREDFASGVIAGIAPPEPSLCLRLVHSKARALGLALEAGLATRLAATVSGNVRRLEGALRSLMAHARLRGRAVDAALALEVLPLLRQVPALPPTVERVLAATARTFGLSLRGLRAPSRGASVVIPRRVAMYVAQKLCGQPAAQLARQFGCNHTTIRKAYRAVAEKLEVDRKLGALVAEIERRLVHETP